MSALTPPPPPSLNPKGNSPSQQGSNVPLGWKPTPAKPIPVVRCTEILDDGPDEGEQCDNWSIRGATVCRKHGGQLPVVRKAAEERVVAGRLRLMGQVPSALDVLFELTQPGIENGIRLKAAQDILDRAGLKAGMEVNVTVEHVGSPLEEINKRMAIMAGRTVNEFGEIEEEPEYEIVDEGEYPHDDSNQ